MVAIDCWTTLCRKNHQLDEGNRVMARLFGVFCMCMVGPYSLGLSASQERSDSFESGRVGFSIMFKGEVTPYRVTGVFVLPNAQLALEAVGGGGSDRFEGRAEAGELISRQPRTWRWTAPPETGLYSVEIQNQSTGEAIRLNIFVLVPFDELLGENLNGYRIGSYPKSPLRGLALYKAPVGFIEVTERNEGTEIVPHFRLRQFLCKQEGEHPKYVVLNERLLLKLELVLEQVNQRGHRCDTFHIMSGYRTPYYNKAIGNVRYSRHVWGGAADVFVDENPKDEMMDDLNRDGRIDYRDAAVLYDIIDELYGRSFYERFLGGLGRYKKTSAHGPFVHIDVRGFRARWGQ